MLYPISSSHTSDAIEPKGARCPVQGKVKFTKKQSARAAADAHMDRDRVGVYRCHQCRYWHVGHWDILKFRRQIMRLKLMRMETE